MPIMPPSSTLPDAATIAAFVTVALSCVTPFLARWSVTPAGSARYSAAVRLANFVLNLAAVIGLASAANTFDASLWLVYGVQAAAQAAGSHLMFQAIVNGKPSQSGSSAAPTAAPEAVLASVETQNAAAPVGATAASSYTSSASSASFASLQAIAASVNADVSAAVAAQK